jgi:Tol biopolymer transport system component/tRNA A-37 threonylcarbamoyl transferase component Bud32
MTATPERLAAALADRYVIERELGQGGMATVYLAHDVRHDRKVALKVLKPELSAILGGERFLAEIKTTANLQHPHILSLFDSGEADGLVFYVMPYVEGESLRDRLTREKQLPVEDAVRIASEVASALDYAHRHGVVHRDIKPENVLLHEGQAQVADFGIALAASRSEGGTRLTETGMSLGTPHYMAPEQAMGEKEITPKADIYALGCVLYEMLAGEPPFNGPTPQAIIARVMTEAPRSLTLQRHTIPAHVEAAAQRALEKLPADRFATAAEFADALAHPASGWTATAPVTASAPRAWDLRRWRRAAQVATAVAVVLGAVAAWGWLRARSAPAVSRLATEFTGIDPTYPTSFAISPDGAHVAYVALDGRLLLRDRDRLDATPVAGGEGGLTPFFSPDGKMLAYCTGYPGALRVVSIDGGAPTTLVPDSASAVGGSWSKDGWIYFVGGVAQALLRVRAGGGQPQLVAHPDSARDELFYNFPFALPGGRAVLFTIQRRRGPSDVAAVEVASGKVTVLTRGLLAMYAPTGHLVVLQSDGSLQAAGFDPRSLKLAGRLVTVIDRVFAGTEGNEQAVPGLSAAGTLIYQRAPAERQVVRIARDGSAKAIEADWTGVFDHVGLSPDGGRLALSVETDGRSEVWVRSLTTGTFTRLAFEGTYDYRPSWTPDGRDLVFVSDRSGHSALYRQPADGSGPAKLLRDDPRAIDEGMLSRDGRWLIYRTGSGGGRDVYAIRPGADSLPLPVATSSFEEYAPALSPDGRWVAYVSNESNPPQVYVRPFPDAAAARWQVSRAGGSEPVWAHSGRELFYRNAAGDLVAAAIAAGPSFRVSSERTLFSARGYETDNVDHAYAVSPDDRSFLFIRVPPSSNLSVVVVLNWFEELKAKVGR